MKKKRTWFVCILFVVWIVTAGTLTVMGFSYYRTPMAERIYSPLHETFGPAGIIGQGLGIFGSLMMLIGVVLYGARKRFRWLARFGTLKAWLQFHIFLCTLGPYLVLLHTTFKFGGVVSIAFWSMAAVVLSGVFGRYVYARIPKTIQGRFLDRSELQTRREELLAHGRQLAGAGLAGAGGPAPELALAPAGVTYQTAAGSALLEAFRHDLGRRSHLKRARAELREQGVSAEAMRALTRVAQEERRIDLQIALLEPFQRMFRYWHAFHLPLAILMFVILGVHIAVAIMFGYTWIF